MAEVERSWDDHRKAAEAFVASIEDSHPKHASALNALSQALYTFSELGLWKMDIDIKDVPEAIRVWAVVETVRRNGFPEDLRM